MGAKWILGMALAGILNFIMPVSVAIDPNCDYYQNLIMTQEYYIYNSQYPGKYKASTSCRWYAQSEVGTRIVLTCSDISLPSTNYCSGDKLRISLSGDENFSDSQNYCGSGTVSLVSDKNRLSIGLFSTWNSPGGSFMCTLTAILVSEEEPTPQPSLCDCGWKSTMRIVGGTATSVNEFPSMVGIIDYLQRELYCGGSIISTRYIITAAHCVAKRNVQNLGALVGDHDISTGADTTASKIYQCSAYEIHPYYNNVTQVNDIAILQTNTSIMFSLYVGPICLPFRYTTYDFYGQNVTALGWGQLEFTGPTSNTLQKVELGVTSNEYCFQQHNETIVYTQMCTYASGKDACQSDSGGPIIWSDPSKNRLQLVGVISYGIGCATDKPGINTRVTPYLSWIVSRTSDATYCIK